MKLHMNCVLMGKWRSTDRKIFLLLQITLTFQDHNPIKSHFGLYLRFCIDSFHRVALVGPLKKFLKDILIGLNVRHTLATILQKVVFCHNFWTEALRKTILVSKSMLLRSRNLMMPFVFYLLPWPLWINILGQISITNGQNIGKL